jgi:hypothetical protein
LRDDPVLTSAFGFGKRICPGRHFVDATLFIYVASLLSVFRIENGQDGQEKQREYKYSEAIVVCVLFHVRIQGNKIADSFLAIRNHSNVPSFLGIKGQKSLLLQTPWPKPERVLWMGFIRPIFPCRVYVICRKSDTTRARVQVISGI